VKRGETEIYIFTLLEKRGLASSYANLVCALCYLELEALLCSNAYVSSGLWCCLLSPVVYSERSRALNE